MRSVPTLIRLPLVLGTSALASQSLAQQPPAASESARPLPVLAEPFKVEASGAPIAVDVGHAAPFVIDFNKDGKKDLVVGQFASGKARVYLNVGTDDQPAFSDFAWLQAGGVDAHVPPS